MENCLKNAFQITVRGFNFLEGMISLQKRFYKGLRIKASKPIRKRRTWCLVTAQTVGSFEEENVISQN